MLPNFAVAKFGSRNRQKPVEEAPSVAQEHTSLLYFFGCATAAKEVEGSVRWRAVVGEADSAGPVVGWSHQKAQAVPRAFFLLVLALALPFSVRLCFWLLAGGISPAGSHCERNRGDRWLIRQD